MSEMKDLSHTHLCLHKRNSSLDPKSLKGGSLHRADYATFTGYIPYPLCFHFLETSLSASEDRIGSRPITSQDGGDWYEKGGPCVQEGEYSHPDRMWAMHIGGGHIPPIIDSRYRRVTLSFTTVVAESWKSLLFIPNIICSALYPFSNIIIYVDSVVPRIVYTEFQRLIESGWVNEIRLVESDPAVYQPMLDGVFNAPPNTTIETKVWGAKGLLSYVQGLEECDTEYCIHIDDGK